MILRTAGGKAKNGITSCHFRRQLGVIERGFIAPFRLEIIKGFGGFLVVNGLINSLQALGHGLAVFLLTDR
ncbi:MAG: hypothetical protein ACI92Z_002480 [Paracoccaceae bacterium]|jgi:hypothetical protein